MVTSKAGTTAQTPGGLHALDPTLVLGEIRWKRALGLPTGDLKVAFGILCYHLDQLARHGAHPTVTEPIVSPHRVQIDEGRHDGIWFRVTYATDAQDPKDWDPVSTDPRRLQNFLEVTLQATWPNTTFTGRGSKSVRPDHLVFNPPGRMQQLRVIEVIHVPLAIHP